MADTLLQALLNLNRSPIETPYGVGALTVTQNLPNMIDPYGNPWANLGIGLGGVLTAALLGYQARQEAMSENLAMQPYITKALEAGSMQELDQLLQQPGAERLGNVGTQLKLRLLENQLDAAAEKRKFEQQLLLERVKNNVVPPGYEDTLGQQGMTLGADFSKPPEENIFGIEKTLDQKRNEYIRQGIAMGLTPNKASEDADKRISLEKASNKAAFDVISTSRKLASSYDSMAATAIEGVAGAGETGGLAGGLRASGSYLAASFGSNEQKQKMAATKLLDSIAPDLVISKHSPGSVSDRENKTLIGSGPNSANTPEENLRLIEGIKVRAGLERDYADFLEEYITIKGDAVGADKLWQVYKDDEVFTPTGYKPSRLPWREYFTQLSQAAKGQTTSEAAAPQAAPSEAGVQPQLPKASNVDAQIAQLETVLSDPRVSEATKAAARAKIDELLGR